MDIYPNLDGTGKITATTTATTTTISLAKKESVVVRHPRDMTKYDNNNRSGVSQLQYEYSADRIVGNNSTIQSTSSKGTHVLAGTHRP